MILIFNKDGTLKMSAGNAQGMENMIADEELITVEYDKDSFEPMKYKYTYKDDKVVKRKYTFTAPPEVEVKKEPTVNELLKRIEALENA
tara:strand:- start:25 stop:291 length:267 start_codon:yes stop_codon:yes gene_type:complete